MDRFPFPSPARMRTVSWIAAISVCGALTVHGETTRGLRDAIQRDDTAEVDRLIAATSPAQHDPVAASALSAAAYYGKTGLVDHLLAGGVPATAVDARGWTALMAAVKGDQLKAVDLLMTHGADPEARPLDGGPSAATLAADLGRTAILERLRQQRPANGNAPVDVFAGAVQDGRLDQIKACLAAPGFKTGGRNAQRALLLAIQRHDPATATALLDHGASADEPADPAGPTPLIAAASSDDLAGLVRTLLARGADENRGPPFGKHPLSIAIYAKASTVALLLIQDNVRTHHLVVNDAELGAVIVTHQPALLEPLLAGGANCDGQSEDGITLLMEAVDDCREAVDPILARHPRLDLRDHDGRSVFERPGGAWLADKMRRAGAGAQVDAVMNQPRRDKAQLTAALLAAVRQGDAAGVRTLLDAGADAQTCNKLGWSISLLAASRGYTDVLRVLHERVPYTVQQMSPNHWSTLGEAAGSGHLETVRFLLACHVPPNEDNDSGLNPADCAEQRGYKEIAQVIREASEQRTSPPPTLLP